MFVNNVPSWLITSGECWWIMVNNDHYWFVVNVAESQKICSSIRYNPKIWLRIQIIWNDQPGEWCFKTEPLWRINSDHIMIGNERWKMVENLCCGGFQLLIACQRVITAVQMVHNPQWLRDRWLDTNIAIDRWWASCVGWIFVGSHEVGWTTGMFHNSRIFFASIWWSTI